VSYPVSEQRIYKADGSYLKPDVITPSGNFIELKPNTPSGRAQGKRQKELYEKEFGKKTKVIFYD